MIEDLIKNFIKEAPIPTVSFYFSYLFFDKETFISFFLVFIGIMYVVFLMILQVNGVLTKNKDDLIDKLFKTSDSYGNSLVNRDKMLTQREQSVDSNIEGYSLEKKSISTKDS